MTMEKPDITMAKPDITMGKACQAESDAEEMIEPLPGTVSQQFIRCGKDQCHCQNGDPHGPYHYRVWREGNTVRKVYVKMAEVEQVRRQCELHRVLSGKLEADQARALRAAHAVEKARLAEEKAKADAPLQAERSAYGLTVSQAAEKLGVLPPAVRAATYRGVLSCVEMQGHKIIAHADVEAYRLRIQSRKEKKPSEEKKSSEEKKLGRPRKYPESVKRPRGRPKKIEDM